MISPYILVSSVCVCYWSPVSEVCPHYGVMMFQPRKLTTPDLGSVAYCYIAYLLNPPTISSCFPMSIWERKLTPAPSPQPEMSILLLHGIIRPLGASPVSVPAHQKTFACLPLTHHFQSPTPPSLPCLRHACRIPTAADPLMPPKYLLTWPSAVVKLPHSSTTVPGAPPVSPSYTPQI